MFDTLPPVHQDPLMHALEIVQRDTRPDKVDLGVGVYMDDCGRSRVLPSIKTAEAWLAANQQSKGYLSSAGNPEFLSLIQPLLLGGSANLPVATVQTVGGSGALSVAGKLIALSHPDATIWVPDPSWANHHPIMQGAGVKTTSYPYYDLTKHAIDFGAMLAALDTAAPRDVVILHGCCHNPSGADLTIEQWGAVARALKRTGAVPLVDIAYQGFAHGLDEDAAGMRLLLAELPDVLVATSFSKNFGLYRDRIGALLLVSRTADIETAWRHMLRIVRTSYSMPPDHGASVIAHILGTPALRAQWEVELADMRWRIGSMRRLLVDMLGKSSYGYIAEQKGMFSFLNINPEQVATLREQHHIYAVGTGRINLAGLNHDNIERVAAAIREVTAA
ncbi:MAG: amino acid aminotransferase [Croceibacterium sp.]